MPPVVTILSILFEKQTYLRYSNYNVACQYIFKNRFDMKKLRINHPKFVVSLIFSILATAPASLFARSLLMGTVQFPHTIQQVVSPIRVYYAGRIIHSHGHAIGVPKVTFEITRGKRQNRFYILITPEISYQLKDLLELDSKQNTIDYLKVIPDQPYKFYVLDLIQDTPPFNQSTSIATLKNKNLASTTPTYHWEIREELLPETGEVPDAAIVICYFPEFVAGLTGGSNLELPTIVLRSDMLECAGSQDKLYEESIKLQLASINSDTIHAPTKCETRLDKQRTLIVYSMT